MAKRVERLEAALRGILTHDNRKLAAWARGRLAPHIVADLERGYVPNHRGASAYRGALVACYREIARTALEGAQR